MKQLYRKRGLISVAFLLLFFQNCSPAGFEVMSSVNESSTSGTGSGSVITPTPSPTTPTQPGTTNPPKVVTPTPTPTPVQPNPGTTTPSANNSSESWMIVNNLGEGGGTLSNNGSATFQSFFPYLKSYQTYDKAKVLYLLVPQRFQGKSVDICFVRSPHICDAKDSKRHTLSISSAKVPGYTGVVIEDFYKPAWLESFKNYYLYVTLEGETRSILVEHRIFVPKNITVDPEQVFYDADEKSRSYSNMHYYYTAGKGQNVTYGFGCFTPSNSGIGWTTYQYDRIGSANSGTCYFRVLNRDQAIAEAARIHIKKYGDNPSLRISCGGEFIQHKKVTCHTNSSTPVLLQPLEKWFWQIGEEDLIPFGDTVNLTAKELGKQSVRLVAYNHSGSRLITSNTFEFTIKENTSLNGPAQNGEIRIMCDTNIKMGGVGRCNTVSYHSSLKNQQGSWAWRVNDSRRALAPTGEGFRFTPNKPGSHQIYLEALDDSGRVLKSNVVTVNVGA